MTNGSDSSPDKKYFFKIGYDYIFSENIKRRFGLISFDNLQVNSLSHTVRPCAGIIQIIKIKHRTFDGDPRMLYLCTI